MHRLVETNDHLVLNIRNYSSNLTKTENPPPRFRISGETQTSTPRKRNFCELPGSGSMTMITSAGEAHTCGCESITLAEKDAPPSVPLAAILAAEGFDGDFWRNAATTGTEVWGWMQSRGLTLAAIFKGCACIVRGRSIDRLRRSMEAVSCDVSRPIRSRWKM